MKPYPGQTPEIESWKRFQNVQHDLKNSPERNQLDTQTNFYRQGSDYETQKTLDNDKFTLYKRTQSNDKGYKPLTKNRMNSQLLDYVFQHEKLDEGYQKKMGDYKSQVLPVQKYNRNFKKVNS
jgi:hypothetical protein